MVNNFIKQYVLFFIVFLCFIFNSYANEVLSIRANPSADNTRIVYDMKDLPKYKTIKGKDGVTFEVIILDINDPQKKNESLKIVNSSVIKNVKIKRDIKNKQLVYIYLLKRNIEPKVSILKASNGQKNRLVIDFPTNSENVKKLATTEKNNPEVDSVKEINNTKDLEAALFEDLNSEGDSDKSQNTQKITAIEAPKPDQNLKKKVQLYKIVIDPGHGGKDPGAIGKNGLQEKRVTLGVSKKLLAYIQADPSMKGFLTRSNDRFIELGDRSEIARKYKADLLISIHADSAANSKARGGSILVLSGKRADRENSKLEKNQSKQKKLLGGAGEAISTHSGNDPYLTSMFIDLASNNSMNKGNELAKEILKSMGKHLYLHKSTPISRSLAVLKAPDIPSLLIETGYLSNEQEEALLKSDKYQNEVAYLIYLGIKEFVRKNPLPTVTSSENYYQVKSGDSLSKIAKKHNMSVEELKELNNLKSNILKVGQKLKVN